jgi:hypothetical protein
VSPATAGKGSSRPTSTRMRSALGRNARGLDAVLQLHELDRSGGTMDRPVFNAIVERVRNGWSAVGRAFLRMLFVFAEFVRTSSLGRSARSRAVSTSAPMASSARDDGWLEGTNPQALLAVEVTGGPSRPKRSQRPRQGRTRGGSLRARRVSNGRNPAWEAALSRRLLRRLEHGARERPSSGEAKRFANGLLNRRVSPVIPGHRTLEHRPESMRFAGRSWAR